MSARSRPCLLPWAIPIGSRPGRSGRRSAGWAIRLETRWPPRFWIRAVGKSALTLADESWSLPVVQALVEALKQTSEPAVRGRIVANLAGQYRKYPEWSGDWWGPDPLAGKFPKKTRDWTPEGMETVLQGLRLGFADRDATVRFQSIVALGEVGPAAAPILSAGLAAEPDPGNQAALVEALGRDERSGDAPVVHRVGVRLDPFRAGSGRGPRCPGPVPWS